MAQEEELPVRSLVFRKFVGDADYLEEDISLMGPIAGTAGGRPAQTDTARRCCALPADPRYREPPVGRTAADVLRTTTLSDDLTN